MISGSSRYLVTAGDGVRVWSLENGNISLHQHLPGCGNVVEGISISPSGEYISSVSPDHGLRLHQWRADEYIDLTNVGLPTAATFCSGRTSKLISYGLSSPPQLVVYEISSKTVKKRLPLPDNGVPCNLTQILWSPKDTHIAVGTSQGSVMVLNYRTYSFSRDLAGHDDLPIRSLTFKDNYLATTDDSGRFAVYDWERESLLHCFEKLHAGPAFDGDISPINSKLMASVGLDKRLQFVDPFIPKVVSTQHLEEPGTAVAFHPMGYQLVVGHSDGSFALIDIRTWKTLLSAVHGQSSSVNSVRFFSDAMIKRMTRSTPGLNTSTSSALSVASNRYMSESWPEFSGFSSSAIKEEHSPSNGDIKPNISALRAADGDGNFLLGPPSLGSSFYSSHRDASPDRTREINGKNGHMSLDDMSLPTGGASRKSASTSSGFLPLSSTARGRPPPHPSLPPPPPQENGSAASTVESEETGSMTSSSAGGVRTPEPPSAPPVPGSPPPSAPRRNLHRQPHTGTPRRSGTPGKREVASPYRGRPSSHSRERRRYSGASSVGTGVTQIDVTPTPRLTVAERTIATQTDVPAVSSAEESHSSLSGPSGPEDQPPMAPLLPSLVPQNFQDALDELRRENDQNCLQLVSCISRWAIRDRTVLLQAIDELSAKVDSLSGELHSLRSQL